MSATRRRFLQQALAAGGVLALGLKPGASAFVRPV